MRLDYTWHQEEVQYVPVRVYLYLMYSACKWINNPLKPKKVRQTENISWILETGNDIFGFSGKNLISLDSC